MNRIQKCHKVNFFTVLDQRTDTPRFALFPGNFFMSNCFSEQAAHSHWALCGGASVLTTWSFLFHWSDSSAQHGDKVGSSQWEKKWWKSVWNYSEGGMTSDTHQKRWFSPLQPLKNIWSHMVLGEMMKNTVLLAHWTGRNIFLWL